MSCELLNGAPAAKALDEKTQNTVKALKARNIIPSLAILRVGEREDDMSYERGAIKRCDKLGVKVKSVVLPATVSQAELMASIKALNEDSAVHGVLMFRPLPKSLDEKAACAALEPAKDMDGISFGSLAKVYSGLGDGFPPCTAQSCMELLKHYGVEISGKRVTVIGRSLVIGRPVAMLLMAENATITICHTKTEDLPKRVREADIVVVAAGRAESIGKEYLREGQIVIDVGISWSDEKQRIVGDVNFDEAKDIVSAITPVPGGIGGVTTAVLASHVVQAAKKYLK